MSYIATRRIEGGHHIQCRDQSQFEAALFDKAAHTWIHWRIQRYPSDVQYDVGQPQDDVPVFGVHYFAADGREIGWYHPDTGTGEILGDPRTWHEIQLAQLEEPQTEPASAGD